eukprot:5652361-Prymnesium_polylepis.1
MREEETVDDHAPMADGSPSPDTIAVAYVAIGQVASEPHLRYSVATLRGRGQFSGSVFVVTDHPQCIPPTAHAIA